MKPPFLIIEAGLHGDGDAEYYLLLIKALRSQWSGWPRIVFKMQHYVSSNGPWADKVRAIHGRPPLDAVSLNDLSVIGNTAREAGFGYAVTFHDQDSLREACEGSVIPLTHIKLGSFDFSQPALRNRVSGTCSLRNWGLVASVFGVSVQTLNEILRTEHFPPGTVLLTGEAKYPSNKPMPQLATHYAVGYSAHNVPSLAFSRIQDAVEGDARVVEVHVTMRPRDRRPLPGDMCVSVTVDQFMDIAEMCGEIWS